MSKLLMTAIILFSHLCNASSLTNFIDRAGSFLSNFSSSGEICNENKTEAKFRQECSSHYKNNIINDLKDGSAFSLRTKIASPVKVCDNLDVNFNNAKTPEQVSKLFSSGRLTQNITEKGIDDYSCFSEIEKLSADADTKNKIKKNLAAEHYINLKRLENGSKNYLTEISTIDSLLGDNIFQGISCRSISQQESVQQKCSSLKSSCQAQGGIDKLAAETEQAIQDLKELNSITTGTYSTRSASEQKTINNLRKLLKASHPLLKGDQFQESLKKGSSVKQALVNQLRANRKQVLEGIKKNENAVSCLRGGNSKQCKGINEVIAGSPEIEKFNIDTSSVGKEAEKDKLASNYYINKVQCFSEIRQLKKEQKKDINDLAINAGLTVLTGGTAAVLGGSLKFAALATRASAYGSKAPKLKAFSDFVKTPLGATRVSVWGADAAFASYEFNDAAKACDKKINALTRIKRKNKNKHCPVSLDTPAYNIQSDYKSCFIEVGLASVGLLPFAPDVVSSLLKGRSIRSLVNKNKFSKEQIDNIVKLQKNINEKELTALLEGLGNLNIKDSTLLLNTLGQFKGNSKEFEGFVGRSIEKLSKEGKFSDPIPEQIASLAVIYKADLDSGLKVASGSSAKMDDENSLEGKYVEIESNGNFINGEVQRVTIVDGEQFLEIVRADGTFARINAKEVGSINAKIIDRKSKKLKEVEFRGPDRRVEGFRLVGKHITFKDADGNSIEGKVSSFRADGSVKVIVDGEVKYFSDVNKLEKLEVYEIKLKDIVKPDSQLAKKKPIAQQYSNNSSNAPSRTEIDENRMLNQRQGLLDENGIYSKSLEGEDVEIMSASGNTFVKGKVVRVGDIAGEQKIQVIKKDGSSVIVNAGRVGTLDVKKKPKRVSSRSPLSRTRRNDVVPSKSAVSKGERAANKAVNKRLGLVNYRGRYKKNVLNHRHVDIVGNNGKSISGIVKGEKTIKGQKYYQIENSRGVQEFIAAQDIGRLDVKVYHKVDREVETSTFVGKSGNVDGSKTVGKYIQYKDANNNKLEGYIQSFDMESGDGAITIINNGVKSKAKIKDLKEFRLYEAKKSNLQGDDVGESKKIAQQVKKATRQARKKTKVTTGVTQPRLPFLRRGPRIKKDSLNGQNVEIQVKSSTGLQIKGEVIREFEYQGQRGLEIKNQQGVISQVLVSEVKKVTRLDAQSKKKSSARYRNQTVRTSVGVDRRVEVQRVFDGINGVQLPAGAVTQNSRSFVLPNGKVKNFTIYNSDRAKGEIKNITTKLDKPLDRGYYTYVILEDGSMSVGKVEDSLEFGTKHANIAAGRKVKLAGELKVDDKGDYSFNVSSGTFTREIAEQFGGGRYAGDEANDKANRLLSTRADKALKKYLGQGVNKEDGSSFFDDLPSANLLKYCKIAFFQSLNPQVCAGAP